MASNKSASSSSFSTCFFILTMVSCLSSSNASHCKKKSSTHLLRNLCLLYSSLL
jgi:hypothetical protein